MRLECTIPLKGELEEWFCLRCGHRSVEPKRVSHRYRKCIRCGYPMRNLPVRKNTPIYIS
jgi:hypothetical protein